jgi:hypothetical protein
MDGKIVIGLSINNERITQKTPGFENSITSIEELNLNSNKISNHFQIIKSCFEYLQSPSSNNNENEKKNEIELLKKKIILLSGNGLIYITSIFISNNKQLMNQWINKSNNSFPQINNFINQFNQIKQFSISNTK